MRRPLLPILVLLGLGHLGCSSKSTEPAGGNSTGGAGVDEQLGGGSGDGSGGGIATPFDAGSPPSHFNTAPVGATVENGQLPTEADCTKWVNAAAPGLDSTETMPCNATANAAAAVPTSAWLTALHANPEGDAPDTQHDAEWQVFQGVTGNFYGSTDMILRWAACKWGIDEDVVRAEAVEESGWIQSESGNCGGTTCTEQGATPPSSGDPNYWVAATDDPSSQTQGGTCCPSKGILQVGLPYWYASPYAVTATALNADFRLAAQRSCMNGDVTWLAGTNGGAGSYGAYPPSDTDTALYGCMGHWDSGSWNDSGAVGYVTQLQKLVSEKAWTTVSCK